MRPRILLTILLTALFVLMDGCGNVKNCPVCGTTTADGYAVIDIMPVPEHNPTGEPGGPFNSFDISLVDSIHHRFFVSDRIGLDIPIFDTVNDIALGIISGQNGVAGGGIIASACTATVPPLVTALGNFTRFACRTAPVGGIPFHIPLFGPSGLFGGWPGAQCCAARANGINPLSGPDGEAISADGNFLFVGNGASSVDVFDLTTMSLAATPPVPPNLIATIPTGFSPDYDGCLATPCITAPPGTLPTINVTGTINTTGITGCAESANGRAFSDPTCGDLRADEMSYDDKDHILLVANGDPGFPFVTLIDMSGVVARTGNCLPFVPNQPYQIQYATAGTTPVYNFPTCIIGQIYYDGAPVNQSNVTVDDTGANATAFSCPDPSVPAPSGVSGHNARGIGVDVPCHHGPIIDKNTGVFCNQTAPGPNCAGATSIAGIGGSAFNPNTGHFLVTNSNSAVATTAIGSIDEIDPRKGNPNGPVIVNSFPMPNCMPTSIVQGPGNNFLVGCADHDGETFPPNEYVIDGSSGTIIATITNVGGVDETWYNPGDNRYYLAARDMPNGPVMGVIDAKTNLWLQNVSTGSNSHSISVDSTNNHVFVPLQAGGQCTTQSSNGCVGVYAQR